MSRLQLTTCPTCNGRRMVRAYLIKIGKCRQCRSCAARERVKERTAPEHVKTRAKLLRARGYGPTEIRSHLADEGHHYARSSFSMWTIL